MTDHEDDVVAAKEAMKKKWIGRPGVTGIDVGIKYVGGKPTKDVAIRLFVRKKLADVTPEERFPSTIGPHKTDVVEREYRLINLPDVAYYNPMPGGVPLQATTGGSTAGMFVQDRSTGELLILGTFHGELPPNSQVYQPTPADEPGGGTSLIGYILRGGRDQPSPVDADVFRFAAPRDPSFTIVEIGAVNGVRTVEPADLGIEVRKRGRTTGLTYATLEGLAGTITYAPDYQGNVITYDNLLQFNVDSSRSVAFALPGDSGSIVVDGAGNAVAMVDLADSAGDFVMGPAAPAVMAALNVVPCTPTTKLTRQVRLTSSELASPAPSTGSGSPWSGDENSTAPWGQSTTGAVTLKPFPTCPAKSYTWTITNVYNTVEFRAQALNYDQPVFRWTINQTLINDFGSDTDKKVLCSAMVWTDDPAHPSAMNGTLQQVTLSCYAEHRPTYELGGTAAYAVISPTTPQGHVLLTVEVEVRDQNAAESPNLIGSQSGLATLDTQQLTFGSDYYADQAKCINNTIINMGLERHPFTLIDLLLSQPDPPPDAMLGIQLLAQLRLELAQLGATRPKEARELSRIFAMRFGVSAEALAVPPQEIQE